MFKKIIFTSLIAIVSTGLFAQVAVVKELTASSFKEQLASSKKSVLLDVRTPQEMSQGFIEGAENVDFKSDDFRKKIAALDKNKTYFVYCASGIRSGKASLTMVEMGFKSVYTLRGGLNAWKEENLPLVKKE
jgi:phage shock protein E